MCGFVGIYNLKGSPVSGEKIEEMNTLIRHRGPDDEGYIFINTTTNKTIPAHGKDTQDILKSQTPTCSEVCNSNLVLGFRRLSILDLSTKGHQPMSTMDGNYWIVFNGEIYNYLEIRKELVANGCIFQSQTDTEVILYAYQRWGPSCVEKFNGMWAFLLYDKQKRILFGSRDRFGIKPFYYTLVDSTLYFSSELKALHAVCRTSINHYSLRCLLSGEGTNMDQHTFFQGFKQLKGGHNIIVSNGDIDTHQYYQLKDQTLDIPFDQAKEKFLEILEQSILYRHRSDVPIGYALSGGLDSSSIVCLSKKLIPDGEKKTFSMIFPGTSVDESSFMRSVIEKTKVASSFITPTLERFFSDISNFHYYQEEPVPGTSYYGEFSLKRLVRENKITVTLEGQGADEIISGYTNQIPYFLIDLLKEGSFKTFFQEKRHFSDLCSLHTKQILKLLFPKLFPQKVFFPGFVESNFFQQNLKKRSLNNLSRSVFKNTLIDQLVYSSIPEQLVRADKSSMTFSLESRFPFLDHNLVEFALALPKEYKLHNGKTKHILRESVRSFFPDDVYKRRDKIGFATPQNIWFRDIKLGLLWEIIHESDFKKMPIINYTAFMQSINDRGFDYKHWKILSVYIWKKRYNLDF